MKIKKGDEVKIIAGKDKGKTGKIIKVFPQEFKFLVEGLNLFKKHAKPRQADKKGEVILVPKPVSISALRLVCPHCHKITRVGFLVNETAKTRICKKCQQAL
ncbi:MAG: 50S ribosomal protein L24 [Patescibacteria group bacterium]